MRLGVDFGTTRTVVAFADRGNYPVLDFPDHAGDASSFIPSVVASHDGQLSYGWDAVRAADESNGVLLSSMKRLLASPVASPHQLVSVGEIRIALGDLLAGFLEHVRVAIETRSRRSRKGTVPTLSAVVAVPAHASSAQRFMTLAAFRRAGFDVIAMLNEPSAAGFEYTHRYRNTLTSKRDLVVVYDLGGGTFDASIVRMNGGHHEVLATSGIPRLGGDDFDEVLARTALLPLDLELDALPQRQAHALLRQCRDVKERLSPSSRKIAIDLEAVMGRAAPRPEIIVAANDYYEACAPLAQRTIDAVTPMIEQFDSEGEIAGVYVTGGASELPVIARTLRDRFGRRVHRSVHPSAAVAIGLAIAADDTLELLDRYSRTFGVFREGEAGQSIAVDSIFSGDTKLPKKAERITRTREYRAAHNIGHYRFFECTALDDSGRPRGDMSIFSDVYFPFDPRLCTVENLAGVAVERAPSEGPRICESYSLDDHGIVDIIIRNLDAGYERTYRLGA